VYDSSGSIFLSSRVMFSLGDVIQVGSIWGFSGRWVSERLGLCLAFAMGFPCFAFSGMLRVDSCLCTEECCELVVWCSFVDCSHAPCVSGIRTLCIPLSVVPPHMDSRLVPVYYRLGSIRRSIHVQFWLGLLFLVCFDRMCGNHAILPVRVECGLI
jgi:hypothetical protein